MGDTPGVQNCTENPKIDIIGYIVLKMKYTVNRFRGLQL